MDGDAVAVREAAAAGMRIVASDTVPRPAGAALFRAGDAQSLSSQLVSAVRDNDTGCLHPTERRDGYEEIVDIYNA